MNNEESQEEPQSHEQDTQENQPYEQVSQESIYPEEPPRRRGKHFFTILLMALLVGTGVYALLVGNPEPENRDNEEFVESSQDSQENPENSKSQNDGEESENSESENEKSIEFDQTDQESEDSGDVEQAENPDQNTEKEDNSETRSENQASEENEDEGKEYSDMKGAAQHNSPQSEEESVTTSSQEKYTFQAQTGDGVTHLSRRAIEQRLQERNQELSKVQHIYAETTLTQNKQYYQQSLDLGESIDFEESDIDKVIDDAEELSDSEVEAWEQYIPDQGLDSVDSDNSDEAVSCNCNSP